MKLKILFLVTSFLALSLNGNAQLIPASTDNGVLWGMNGHPLNQPTYKVVSLQQQFEILRELNIRGYRIDVPFTTKDLITNKNRIDSILILCKIYNITLLPMIYTTPVNANKSLIYNESLGHSYAKLFCQYFKECKYVELGNEMDLHFNQSDIFDTQKNTLKINNNKNTNRFACLAAYMKGFIDEVHKNYPQIKTLVDFAYNDTWFLKALARAGANFDIIAPHFYSTSVSWSDDSKNNYSRGSFINLVNQIFTYFRGTKDVWITEYNYRGGSYKAPSEEKQKAVILSIFNNIKQLPCIKAVFFYELLDQPFSTKINPNITEQHFGFTQYNVHTKKVEIKPFFKK